MTLYIEIIAVVFSFLSVLLAVRKSVLTWSFGVIGILSYALIFVELDMPAQTFLQVIFLIQALYGWYMWNKPKEKRDVQSLDDPDLFFLVAILASILLSFMLITSGWSKHPGIDAISTVFSIFANFFLANKVIQTWLYWAIVNTSLIIVFYLESMYPSAILYGIFLTMSLFGYISWRKDLKTA